MAFGSTLVYPPINSICDLFAPGIVRISASFLAGVWNWMRDWVYGLGFGLGVFLNRLGAMPGAAGIALPY